MKKFIIAGALALATAAVPVAATHASDPYSYVPACVLSLDPTLHYSTVSFQCEAFTDPDTGIYYNAINIATPVPPQL